MTKDFMKSTRFHPEIWQIWPVKSSGFHPDITCKNPPKIIKASVSAKTLQFDECRMGDFTLKSGGFHPWNLADFTQIWPVKSTQNYKSKCFSKNSSVWWMQCGGLHPRNPVDFTLKSGGFQPWNLVDFTQISPVKSTQNYKTSVSAKTLQFDECRVGAMTKDFMKSTRFHPEVWWISSMKSGRFHPDFTCEIHPNYKSKCFSKNSSVWWMQGRGYDQGFHEIHQISPWNLADLTCEIQWISPRYHL